MPSLSRWLATGLGLICLAGEAHALDPNHTLSQYLREQWTTDNNFPGGAIDAITQTADGYLWMGTEKGLVRFDGVNFRVTSSFSEFSGDPVSGLTTDGEGRLCVIFWGAGVLCYRDKKFVNLASALRRTTLEVASSWREEDGASLLTDLVDGILRVRGENVQVLVPPTILPPSLVLAIAKTRDGKIWLGTVAGLFYFADGRTERVTDISDKKINCLLPVGERELWVGTSKGLYRWNGTLVTRVNLPRSLAGVQVLTLLRDHDGNIWAGTTLGLLRINAAGVSFSDEGDFGSGGINALFEDREGNLWAGGGRGLERIRDSTFVTYALAAGTPHSKQDGPVYVDGENRTWFAPAEGGLYLLDDGRAYPIKSAGLDRDVVYSITGSKGETWVGRQHGGLTRLQYSHGTTKAQSYTEANGLAQNSVYAVYQSADGAVWAGTLSGGVSRFKDGRFITYTNASGLASNTVTSILDTRDGAIWFATSNGLSSLSNGQWRTYAASDGLPSENVNCLFEDSSGMLWTGTLGGLAFLISGHVQVPGNLPELLRGEIFGIAEDKDGWFWIATSSHVLRVQREKLAAGMLGPADVREYGVEDGLRSIEGVKRNRSVVSDPLGRIWFSLSRGMSVVDPSHLTGNSAPAIAHVETVSADGSPINAGDLVHVPASPKRITFSYTGLSLAVPERVRFRYFLDGFDRNWSEPTAAREAVYTNLSPGSYRFRVIASNSDGMWNGSEATLPFEVDPALWQTWWFRLSGILMIGLAVLMFFRLRVLRLTKQMNMRFEERLAERTRIAQELHDTLLQGFLSASMQLHVADDHLGTDSPAKPFVGRVLELMDHVIEEGRNAVQGLRLPNRRSEDLEQAFARIQQELDVAGGTCFRVVAEGVARPLRPIIREEVYRIGREALANAFRHSRASDVEVELEYAPTYLRLLVRDNGSGIDPEVVRAGREGHWGLSVMRERAERIGARFTVLSGASSGTEIELSIPGHIAFKFQSSERRWGWLLRLSHRKAREQETKTEGERQK